MIFVTIVWKSETRENNEKPHKKIDETNYMQFRSELSRNACIWHIFRSTSQPMIRPTLLASVAVGKRDDKNWFIAIKLDLSGKE